MSTEIICATIRLLNAEILSVFLTLIKWHEYVFWNAKRSSYQNLLRLFRYCTGPDEFPQSDYHQIIENRLLSFLWIRKVKWVLLKFDWIVVANYTQVFTIMQKPHFRHRVNPQFILEIKNSNSTNEYTVFPLTSAGTQRISPSKNKCLPLISTTHQNQIMIIYLTIIKP